MSQCNCPVCRGYVPSVAEHLLSVRHLMRSCDHGVKAANQFLQELKQRFDEKQQANFMRQCEIARQFDQLSPGLQFRAIIEEWSEPMIVHQCKVNPVWGQ